ncbi:MAG: gamma-glutamyltransferase [Alphaproteobacteria bacterium]|nr:gamma-glutamyltransferase [Alphaproteobacteria bacterium]
MNTRRIGAAALVVLLGGCSLDVTDFDVSDLRFSKKSSNKAFVVGDEPYAVRTAATLISQGGNAVDAAAAMYFALSVTYPVSAGLGGGGICLVHDPKTHRNFEFDFLARSATSNGTFAVPGAVRGMAQMQTSFGALPWQRVVSPAEGLAAVGFPISQALAARLSAASDVVRLDAGLAAEFLDESGKVREAGSVVANPALGETLAAIRVQGSDALYAGPIAERIAAYAASQGGAITQAEIAAYRAQRSKPLELSMGETQIALPGASTGAGIFAGKLFAEILRAELAQSGNANTEAAVVEGTKRALSGFAVSDLPHDLGATGFAATDNSGQAVACAMTMNGPFGSGHSVPGVGVTLARAPASSTAGLASAFLTPVLATDAQGNLALAGAGAGGPVGTASIADALARLAKGEAVTRRASNAANGDTLYDTVNAILCQNDSCTALPDAGASGLGMAP